jgi:Cft2 family RNA processing exonuclease
MTTVKHSGMASRVEIVALGAGKHVGKSCIVATCQGVSVMFDCGVDLRSESPFPDVALLGGRQPLCILLSHAHIDHTGGLLATLEALGGAIPVFATPATRDLTFEALRDWGEYPDDAILTCVRKVRTVEPHQSIILGSGLLRATCMPIGHLLGAVAWFVEFGEPVEPTPRAPLRVLEVIGGEEEEEDGSLRCARFGLGTPPATIGNDAAALAQSVHRVRLPDIPGVSDQWKATVGSVLYTGDVGSTGEMAAQASSWLSERLEPDVLVMEHTLEGSARPPRASVMEAMVESVRQTVEGRGADCLIATFSLGRAQEVREWLVRAALRASIEYVGESVATEAPEPLESGALGRLVSSSRSMLGERSGAPSTLASRVHAVYDSHKAVTRREGEQRGEPRVFIGSPMGLNGGKVVDVFEELADKEESLVVFTGKCPELSPGAKVQGGATSLTTRGGALIRVKCRVETYPMSAHADGEALARLATRIQPRAGVVLVHHEQGPVRKVENAEQFLKNAAGSLKAVLQDRLDVPVYDPPDGVAVAMPLVGSEPVVVKIGAREAVTDLAELGEEGSVVERTLKKLELLACKEEAFPFLSVQYEAYH